jgi:hypothetical protein
MERIAFYMIDAFWFLVNSLSTAIEHNGNKLYHILQCSSIFRGGFQCQENESVDLLPFEIRELLLEAIYANKLIKYLTYDYYCTK